MRHVCRLCNYFEQVANIASLGRGRRPYMSMSLGWKICRTIVEVSFNQSLLLLSSNWPCDFNWKANWTYCLLCEGIDRTGPVHEIAAALYEVVSARIYFHISSEGIHDARGINVLSLSVIELKCNIIEICKMLPDAFARCKFKHICDSRIIRNCNKRGERQEGEYYQHRRQESDWDTQSTTETGKAVFPVVRTVCVCVLTVNTRYGDWLCVCMCVCARVQLRWHRYLHMHIIVFCTLLLPSISPPPRFVSVYLFYRLWSNFPLHTFFFFLIYANKWEISQKIHDASDSVPCDRSSCCSSCWFAASPAAVAHARFGPGQTRTESADAF